MPRSKQKDGAQSERSNLKSDSPLESNEEPPLDRAKLEQRMKACGIKGKTELADLAGIHRGTVHNVLRTGNGSRATIDSITQVLQVEESELRRYPTFRVKPEPKFRIDPPNDWKIVSIESPCLMAANGVSYQVAKLESTITPGHFSRAKLYNLLHTTPQKVRESSEQLKRHAQVCVLLKDEGRILKHLDIRPLDEDTAWWVLNHWMDATPLSRLLESGTKLEARQIKTIGSELLLALHSLHQHKVIVRELAPERILISDGKFPCIITDFELAKLLDSDISVSGKWKFETDYRAPEVGGNDPHIQSDLYSWAIIITELLTGKTVADQPELESVVSNKSIVDLIFKCRDKRYHYRPTTAENVLSTWKNWKPK